jgi:hypothetical protein
VTYSVNLMGRGRPPLAVRIVMWCIHRNDLPLNMAQVPLKGRRPFKSSPENQPGAPGLALGKVRHAQTETS